MKHYDSLWQLMPFKLDGVLDADIYAEALELDEELERLRALEKEMFPDTTEELLSGWERVLAITPSDGATVTERRNAIIAKKREIGGANAAHLVSIAAGMGYSIEISTNNTPLIVGVSTLPHLVMPAGALWGFTVTVNGVSAAPDLENKFNRIKRAHTEINYVYNP